METSKILKEQIKNSGLKHTYIAEKSGITIQTLSRFFKTGTIGLNNLERICDVLGLEIVIEKTIGR